MVSIVCGGRVGNGRRRVVVRDLPIAGVPTVLVWDKRTFRCREQLCPRSSWSETSPLIAVRASLTERARAEICRRVGHDLDTVAEVAREFGVGWGCAHQAVIDHGDALIAADMRVERTVGVGVDEHTFQHANARRRTQMAITFVDIDRARLLDVVPGRSGDVVREWVTERPDGWAEQIQVATIDAFRGYATAIGDVLAGRDVGDRSLPRHPLASLRRRRAPPRATRHPRSSRPQARPALRDPPAAVAHLGPPVRTRLGTPPRRARRW